MGRPSASYLICATPRSGSSLLSAVLAATRSAGVPAEYFNPAIRDPLAERWGCDPRSAAYVRTLHARRSSENGVFGLKLHWFQLLELHGELLADEVLDFVNPYELDARFLAPVLPDSRYLHIVRRDIGAQAVSLFFAWRTQQWALSHGTTPAEPPPYDYDAIDRGRRLIESAEVSWDRFFRFNKIDPLVVVYEEFVDAPSETLRAVGRLVGHPIDDVPSDPPWLRVQRTRVTDEYARRYIAERYARGWGHPSDVDGRPAKEPAAV